MSKLPSVLVIDGELRSVEALERILEDDFIVFKATAVREAEAILAGEAIQVVLCDQRMPGIAGVEFLKTVRERWPEALRMIVPGYTGAEDNIQGVNEAGILRESLIRHRWNKSKAAKELGHSRAGLRAKLERYGLEKIEGLPMKPATKYASVM